MGIPSDTSRPTRPLATVGLALLAVTAIGWVDVATGPEFGLSLFYAVPVFLAADRAGTTGGVIIAVASTLAWSIAQVRSAPSSPKVALLLWNVAVRGVLFGALVALSSMRRKYADERRFASTDPLTGIPNRRMLDEVLARELARVRRKGHSLTVAYIDCDNFKEINDRFGHSTGNEVLRIVARTLRTGIRETDLAARIGGDEFVILLVEATGQQARDILDRIVAALGAVMKERSWPLTLSVGVATTSFPGSADELLERADRLMYRAKTSGKSAIVQEIIQPAAPGAR